MKVGIISDIHSNIEALRTVLYEFEKLKVDKIICCGDMIGIGANPEEVINLLIENKDKLICVIGNHEGYLLNGLPKHVHEDKREMSADEINNHLWNHSNLSEKSKQFIATLPICKNIMLENKKCYITHYPVNVDGSYKKIIKAPNDAECEYLFENIDADIFLYGHNHTVSVNNVNNKYYINPGSLGCPINCDCGSACLLEIENNVVHYSALKIKYDIDSVINKIKEMNYPFSNEVIKIFYRR